MSTTKTNWKELSLRLLAAMQCGVRLEGQDGHIWIMTEKEPYEFNLEGVLVAGRVCLNNKIYGGVIQALDTIDEALKMCDEQSLLKMYDEEIQFLGESGVDGSRIDKVKDGKGGTY